MNKKRLTAGILFLIGIGFIIFAVYPQTKGENSSVGQTAGLKTENSPSPSPTVINSISSPVPSPAASPTPEPAVTNSPAPSPSPVNQQSQVNLSINGGSSFSVNINSGDNQCDVLTRALEQGKISSLNMQYNNSLGSNAVFQINGLGKENSVWWTYKVNGVAPTQGCSYIKANNGDKIEWTYIGS